MTDLCQGLCQERDFLAAARVVPESAFEKGLLACAPGYAELSSCVTRPRPVRRTREIANPFARLHFRMGLELENLDRDVAVVAGVLESLHDGHEVGVAEAGPFQVLVIGVKVRNSPACARMMSAGGSSSPLSMAFTSRWSLKAG